jgi:hypothetical protein
VRDIPPFHCQQRISSQAGPASERAAGKTTMSAGAVRVLPTTPCLRQARPLTRYPANRLSAVCAYRRVGLRYQSGVAAIGDTGPRSIPQASIQTGNVATSERRVDSCRIAVGEAAAHGACVGSNGAVSDAPPAEQTPGGFPSKRYPHTAPTSKQDFTYLL